MIEILCIDSANDHCGIREYSRYLEAHLDPARFIWRRHQGWLDPQNFFGHYALRQYQGPQVVWLNYHAALHSRWTPATIDQLRLLEVPVVVTYHDTGVPNSTQCLNLYAAVDHPDWSQSAFIVHEPCDDLPGAIYLRQGVPSWQPPRHYFDRDRYNRPLVGTVGFPFPWKNYDLLCRASALAGWSTLLLAPGATDDQVLAWATLNPYIEVIREFLPASSVVSYLAGCDATAFLYMCANTGTSGAIRQGLAARKPLLATRGCRQFRDLEGDYAIRWLSDLSPEGVASALSSLPITSLDAGIHRIAERDSWATQAKRYAQVFESVLEPR
jgi:glycosyltransferase involved in cell wall biosynthesis